MGKYKVRLNVYLTQLIEIEAENEYDAIERAKLELINGEIMGDICNSEFYDGCIVDLEDSF